MKRILSFVMAVVVSVMSLSIVATAATTSKITASKTEFYSSGDKSITDIIAVLDKFNNSEYTKTQMKDALSTQLIATDIYLSGAEKTDIYGVQFSLSANTDGVALAYFDTSLQNSNKAGISQWFATLKAKDQNYKTAQVLMYGTKSTLTETNKNLNLQSDGRIKIGTLYVAVAKNTVKDIEITCTVEDIAAKNKAGEVVSVLDNFSKTSKFQIKYNNTKRVFATMLGAQIRTSGKQGLRFGTKVVTDEFFKNCTDVTYGTLIAPTASLKSDKLTLEYTGTMYKALAVICEKNSDYTVFCGAISGFPENGKYNDTNFTAVGYVKYKAPNADKYTVVYTEAVIRNVNSVKSLLK